MKANMKAKMKPHKLLSMLLALVMVVGMLPAMGQVAYAYSAGEIAGTTGSGASEADPVVCDTFAEFKAAMENTEITYVKLTGIIDETIPAKSTLTAAIEQTSPKTLIVEGKNTIIAPMGGNYNDLLYVRSELNIKGSGTLEYRHGNTGGVGAVIYVAATHSLTIQDVTLVGSTNGQNFGRALYLSGASKTKILSGTFSGYSASVVYDSIDAVIVDQEAELTIEDGSFYATANADSIKTYGLVNKSSTTKVTLNGGTYDGIDASKANCNLSDMLGTDCYYTDSNGTVDMTSVMNTTERLTVRTKRIDAVDVSIPVPVVGNHPQDASSNTYNVNVTKTAWSCNDVEISAPNTFDAGNTYQVHVEVQASNDCTFADSPTITINGSTAVTDYSRVNDTSITFDAVFTPENIIIDTVDVTITEPVAGAEPQDAVSNTANVSVSTTEWYHNGTKLSASDTFAAGETYKVHVIVYPDSGYAFADNPTATFNGSKTGTLYTNGKGYINYYAEFTAANAPIDSVDVKITEPVAGAQPQDAVSNTANVSVGTTEWYHNGTKLSASDTFAAGETYKVHVIVYPDSGYAFADNPTATFNGSKTGTLYTNGKDYINYYAEFTTTAESTEYTIAVTNGKATVGAGTEISKAAEGTTVTLTANAASDGMIFDKWVVEDGSASITLADANSATTTFTMPAGEVSVKATYRSYITINLAAGEGSGTMEPLILKATYGYYELIAPDCTFTPPANKVFDKWQFSKDDSYLKPGDTKTIWSSANGATLTAIWKDAPVTPAINSVTVSPATAEVVKGKTQQFTATVDKTGDIADTVTWSVNSTKSTISDTGLLTVGADETAKTLTVTATSTADTTKSGTATVTVKVPVFYITVTNGKVTDGAGNSLVAVPEGAGIIFTANEPETGKQFKEWTGLDGVEFVDGTSKTSSTAKIKMPARAVTATAVYEDAPNANPAKPTISVNGTYIYTGSEQTATVSGYDSTTMNITGNVGTNAGGYTVSVTSKTGKWADGTTDAVTADWSIQKANPTYEVPTGLEGTKGNALSTVTLPAGFTWADGTTEMNTTGNQTFPATFTPSDTDNYNVVNNISVTVNVKEAAPTTYEVTVTNGTGGGNYAAGATVTITANAAPSGQMFDKWEVVSGSITLADANSATTTFTMPAGEVSVKATYKAAPHIHTFDQETIKDAALKTAADCTHDAVYYKSCSCGAISTNDADTFTAAGSALGHDYTKKVENNTYLKTAASKCTEYNVYWYACSRCDANAKDDAAATDKYYTSTTAGNHSFTEKIEDAAHYVAGTGTNCQNVKKYYYDCAYCDQIGTTTWNSTTYGPHDYDTVWSNDKSGHWHECSLCHDKKDEAAHTPGAAATETTPQKCTECDYIITPALGHTHSLTPVAAKDATCTNDGNTAYYVCSGCSKWYEDAAGNVEITDHSSVVRGALGHNWKAATCTAPKTCNTCGATEGDPLGHSEGTEWKYDSENHWHTCTVAGCGVVIDSSKAAHTPDRAAATETDPVKCSVCGYVITPASGHTHDVDTTKYESDETNHWNTCSGCSEKLNISAHDFEWKIDKDATATEKGSKHEECMVCGYARPAVEIPATGSTPEPGDNSNMFLWIALLSVSGVGVVTIIVYVYVKKRKSVK